MDDGMPQSSYSSLNHLSVPYSSYNEIVEFSSEGSLINRDTAREAVIVCLTGTSLYVTAPAAGGAVRRSLALERVAGLIQQRDDGSSVVCIVPNEADLYLQLPAERAREFITHMQRGRNRGVPLAIHEVESVVPYIRFSPHDKPIRTLSTTPSSSQGTLRSTSADFLQLSKNNTVRQKLTSYGDTAVYFSDRVHCAYLGQKAAPENPTNVIIVSDSALYVTELTGRVIHRWPVAELLLLVYVDSDTLVTVQVKDEHHYFMKQLVDFLHVFREHHSAVRVEERGSKLNYLLVPTRVKPKRVPVATAVAAAADAQRTIAPAPLLPVQRLPAPVTERSPPASWERLKEELQEDYRRQSQREVEGLQRQFNFDLHQREQEHDSRVAELLREKEGLLREMQLREAERALERERAVEQEHRRTRDQMEKQTFLLQAEKKELEEFYKQRENSIEARHVQKVLSLESQLEESKKQVTHLLTQIEAQQLEERRRTEQHAKDIAALQQFNIENASKFSNDQQRILESSNSDQKKWLERLCSEHASNISLLEKKLAEEKDNRDKTVEQYERRLHLLQAQCNEQQQLAQEQGRALAAMQVEQHQQLLAMGSAGGPFTAEQLGRLGEMTSRVDEAQRVVAALREELGANITEFESRLKSEKAVLQQRIDQLESKVISQQRTIVTQQENITSAASEVAASRECKNVISSLQFQIEELRRSHSTMLEKVKFEMAQQEREERRTLEEVLRINHQTEISKLNAAHSEKIDTYERKLRVAQETLTAADEYEKMYLELQRSVGTLTQKISHLQGENTSLQSSLTSSQAKVSEQEKLIFDTQRALATVSSQCAAAQDDGIRAKKHALEASAELEAKERAIAMLQGELDRQHIKLCELEGALERQSAQYEEQVNNLDDRYSERESHSEGLRQSLQQELGEKIAELKTLQIRLADAESRYQDSGDRLRQVLRDLSEIKAQSELWVKEREELEDSKIELELKGRSMEELIDRQNVELLAKEREMQKMLDEEELKMSQHLRSLNILEATLRSQDEMLQNARQEVSEYLDTLRSKDVEISTLRERVDNSEKIIEEKMREFYDELAAWKDKVEMITQINEKLENDKQELQREVDFLNSAFQARLGETERDFSKRLAQAKATEEDLRQKSEKKIAELSTELEKANMELEDRKLWQKMEYPEAVQRYKAMLGVKETHITELEMLLQLKEQELAQLHDPTGSKVCKAASSQGKPGKTRVAENDGLQRKITELTQRLQQKQKVLDSCRHYSEVLERLVDQYLVPDVDTKVTELIDIVSQHPEKLGEVLNQLQSNTQSRQSHKPVTGPAARGSPRLDGRQNQKKVSEELALLKTSHNRELRSVKEMITEERAVVEAEVSDMKQKLRRARERQIKLEKDLRDVEELHSRKEREMRLCLERKEEEFTTKEIDMSLIISKLMKDLKESEMDVIRLESTCAETKEATRVGELERALIQKDDRINDLEVERVSLHEEILRLRNEYQRVMSELQKFRTQQQLLDSSKYDHHIAEANDVAARSTRWIMELEGRLKEKEEEIIAVVRDHKSYLEELQAKHEYQIQDYKNKLQRVGLPSNFKEQTCQTEESISEFEENLRNQLLSFKKKVLEFEHMQISSSVQVQSYKHQIETLQQSNVQLKMENIELNDHIEQVKRQVQHKERLYQLSEENKKSLDEVACRQKTRIEELIDDLTVAKAALLDTKTKLQSVLVARAHGEHNGIAQVPMPLPPYLPPASKLRGRASPSPLPRHALSPMTLSTVSPRNNWDTRSRETPRGEVKTGVPSAPQSITTDWRPDELNRGDESPAPPFEHISAIPAQAAHALQSSMKLLDDLGHE